MNRAGALKSLFGQLIRFGLVGGFVTGLYAVVYSPLAGLELTSPQVANLAGYFDRLMSRPSVARVIEEARPYFPYFPFNEAIPQRFLG